MEIQQFRKTHIYPKKVFGGCSFIFLDESKLTYFTMETLFLKMRFFVGTSCFGHCRAGATRAQEVPQNHTVHQKLSGIIVSTAPL